jgi:hypothetical protein
VEAVLVAECEAAAPVVELGVMDEMMELDVEKVVVMVEELE